jgi:quercetin dioxygenase-like cupin family protein
MYCRELFRPAGTVIVGKVHKKEHFYIVMSGEVTIVGNGKRERVKAPKIFVCQPGTKRAVYAHEDSVCITVHRTSETDLEKIEADLVEEDPESMYLAGNVLKHPRIT